MSLILLLVAAGLLCLVVGGTCVHMGLSEGLWSRPTWRRSVIVWLCASAVWLAAAICYAVVVLAQ